MNQKLFIFFVFAILAIKSFSVTWVIKQDGTGNFITIQEGINASADTDTVLVYPGTYYENLDMTGKNITLASLEMTTSDPQYIGSTIIDGQRLESCILIHYAENVIIRGFTIQNGYGTWLTGNDGGGIQAVYVENGLFCNCIINNNIGQKGGAFYTALSNLIFSGLHISENSSALGGGAYFDNQTNITFDPDNLCDIYNNNAGKGADLFANYAVTAHVVVDTFTVFNPDKYFAEYDMDASYAFDIQHNWMELISQDLYVSPNGDDANSGFSPSEPLKNVSWAVRKIQPDSLHQLTIHVAAGTYSYAENQQVYPIGSKPYLSIIGEDMESTILNNDYAPCTLMGWDLNGNLTFANFTLNNFLDHIMSHMIYLREIDFMELHNITIDGNENFRWNIIGEFVEAVYDNVIITNNHGLAFSGISFGLHKGILKNSIIMNNSLVDEPMFNGSTSAMTLACYDNFQIENTIISSNSSTNENNATIAIGNLSGYDGYIVFDNCLISDNVSAKDYMMNVSADDGTFLNNVTFANNSSSFSTLRATNNLTMRNCIMQDDTDYEIYLFNTTTDFVLDVDNCNIKNGFDGIYNENNANVINWGDNNIGDNPIFDSLGTYPYALLSNSPCIDTGTPDTTGLFLPPWDLLYNQRVWDGNNNGEAIIDMGCYEFGADTVGVYYNELPVTNYELRNYPNPFNPETKIVFNLPESGRVKLEIFNIKGQKVKTLIDNNFEKGQHSVTWIGKDDNNQIVSSGVYFYKFSTPTKILTKRMLLLK
ncbi:MAG: T9SS type A sorting domain-containing protein [Melioribacteraceae bacterium]|nr:T9SS type A sorting domain-containing protein [Melioribacteraceae bacterium]